MALTNNINYLQPTGFKLVVDRRRFANFAFFAQSVAHPNVSVNEAITNFRGYRGVPFAGDVWEYGTLEVNVIADEDLQSYKDLYNWMKYNMDNEEKPKENANSTYSDVTLSILTSKNNTNQEIRYVDCFPTNLGNIQMEANADATTIVTFPLTLKYTYFELVS